MDWWIVVLIFFVMFFLFMSIGMPIAFSFLTTNIITITVLMGFQVGMKQLVQSIYNSLTNFSLTPIPLYILMGELLFTSGVALRAINVFNSWLRLIPGRMSVLAVVSGTAFAALSGSNIANTSMLGSLLAPEMRKQGYHPSLSIGSIMASGSLAMIIPPSAMIVLLGSIASISVGPLLMAGVIPGLLMALLFIIFIILASIFIPSYAPRVERKDGQPIGEMIRDFVVDIFPLLVIIFCVIGFIFLGIATPTESAAIGCIVSLFVIASKRSLSWKVLSKSLTETLKINGMILLIVSASAGFGQLLSYSGASGKMVDFIAALGLPTALIIIAFLFIVFLMGFFIEPISVMMITTPLFLPILKELDINLIWFGIMMLICLDLGNLTPPVGMNLFVMKGVLPDVPINEIYLSAIPFILLELLVVLLIFFFPAIALWLPSIAG